MRELHVTEITAAVKELCIKANMVLPEDLCACIRKSADEETFPLAKDIMGDICDNISCAEEIGVPICQDTGMAVVFVELGQDVHLIGGSINQAIDAGVSQGYLAGNLRCSIVGDPLKRVNTGDNTPAVRHISMVDGEQVKITVSPKGFGSENMSAMKMFTPSSTREDIIEFVVSQAESAGSNPCPPIVVGVGIGGDFELCAYLAKKALCRPVSEPNRDELYAGMEQEMLRCINETGIGPQGFGGRTTALAVGIETYPTHIAGLPVAVNIGCHVTRHASRIL